MLKKAALAGSIVVWAVVMLAVAVRAETYNFSPDGTHNISIGTNGSNADGVVAVSDSGYAHGRCIYGGSFLGCLTGPGVGVSVTGPADGAIAASGTGNTASPGLGWGVPAVSASGTGCATAGHPYGTSSVVVSGTGCATGTTDPFWGGYAVAVSGGGPASGSAAVSGLGDASARSGRPYLVVASSDVPGAAVSGTGNATGGAAAVAVAGGDADAQGGVVAVAPLGDARGGVVNVDLQ